MKKIISILACVCLLLSAIVVPASAADSNASYAVADSVSTGTAYKFGMIQEKVSTTDVYYITGVKSGYYMATTTDISAAADVYLEETTGGYYLTTTVGGAKKYINMVVNDTHVNGEFEDAASSVYTFDAEKKTLISNVNGDDYWFGTRNDKTYTTVGPVKVSYNGFYCKLYAETTNGGEVTPPVTPPAGDDDEDEPVVTPPSANSATYSFADYVVEGELGGSAPVRELDDNVTFSISSGWITSDTARIYKNSNAVISSKVDIESIVVNAGYKDSTFVVYTSTDGENWVEFDAAVAYTVDYADITINFDPAVKYIKIDAINQQVRMKTLTVNFVAADDDEDEPVVTPPADDDTVGNVVLTVDSLGLTANAYTDGTATVDGTDFEWEQLGNYGNGIQVRDNAEKASTSIFWNTSAFAAPIKEIRLVYNSAKTTYDNPDAEIFSFGNEAGTYTYETKFSTTAGVKEYTITPDAETYTFFKFEHDYDKTAYWDSITIVLAGSDNGGDDDEEDEPVVTPPVENNDPAADSELSIADAIALGVSKEHNTYTSNKYYVTGKIVESYGGNYATYGNFYIEDDAGNKLLIYGIYNADGTVRYDALETKPVIGDTIKVYGILGQYNNNAQMKNSWLVEHVKGDASDTPAPEAPAVPEGFGVITSPAAGTAYKFGMYQANLQKTLYLTGEMNGFYMATTDDVSKAADVYLEETTGGYYIYAMVGGAKKYLGITEAQGNDGKTHINAVYTDTAASVFTYNETIKTYVTKLGEKEYGFGTRSDASYNTISPSESSYTDNFVCKFYGEGGVKEEIPEVKPVVPENKPVEAPVAGTAYKFASIQTNLNKVLYVTGEMDGFYMATTEKADEAADVYLEETTGGYFIYALVGGVKKYMNIVETEGNDGKTHVNAVYGEAGVSVFTQNTEKNVFVTKLGDAEYAFGTYKTFSTVSPSNFTKYPDNFWCQFYTGAVVTEGTEEETKEEEKTESGSNESGYTFGVVEQPVVGTAYKFGMYQANLKKTLYITGEMDGFYMATTEDVSKAADVYLEQTTGGYYIYAMVKGARKYLGITEAQGNDGKTHINAVYTDKPESVFTYNATLKTYVTKVGDKEYGFGTRNDREFKTVSPSETKYTDNFFCKFYGMTKTSPGTGDNFGSAIAMTIAAAAVILYTSKKR